MNNKQKYILGAVILVLVIAVIVSTGISRQNSKKRPEISIPRVAYVRITEDGFTPTALKIKAGTEVIWTNSDTEEHAIEAAINSNYQSLNSRTSLDTHGTYRYTFDKKGNYQYHDKKHPLLNGIVIVE